MLMDRSILVNSEVNEFVSPIYDLSVSRVWRGAGIVFFVEFGDLSSDGKRGKYTLMIEGQWKLLRDGVIFDGNEEPYESIDTELDKLIGQKVLKIEFHNTTLDVFFEGGKIIQCDPSNEFFVSLIQNSPTKYLNFGIDGSTSFSDGNS